MPANRDDTPTWDAFYSGPRAAAGADGAAVWSGSPNHALVTEVAGLATGTALDVGCGEGADAIWLAKQGWEVTALDPSGVALARAKAAGAAAGVTVDWVRASLRDRSVAGQFDLVSAQYPVLPRGPDESAVDALLDRVASGGTLLFVHHDFDAMPATDHPDHLEGHVMPGEVVARLDARWLIEVHERRPNPATDDGGRRHPVGDVVLRARRR